MAADIIPIVNQPIYQETSVVSQVVDDTYVTIYIEDFNQEI